MAGLVLNTNRLTIGTLNAPGVGAGFGTTHARIGYENHCAAATLTASSAEVDFPADAVQNSLTYDLWRPATMSASLEFDFGTARTFDYIGIAAHTMGDENTTVIAEYSTDGVAWTDLNVSVAPADNRAVMLLFEEVLARWMRLRFVGNTVPSVGVVYCGEALEMYRPFYGGHTPGVLSRKTTVKPNRSVNGQWLGRSVIREGLQTRFDWRHTPIDWYETNVDPFVEHARVLPFFIAWNPQDFGDHVMYAWTSDDIAPTLMGVRDLCEFGFSVEGIE